MVDLDLRRIRFVKKLPVEAKARVLYEFLKKGTSNRNIEKLVDILKEEDGWQAWSVVHFYGFNKSNKATFPSLTLKLVEERLRDLNDDDLEDFHLRGASSVEGHSGVNITMRHNDGRDIFRTIKGRQGQYKLRKLLLLNYQSKCALCNITHPKLLITSHIKPWSVASYEERVDPRNGILLCKIHDGLFENGFISLNDNYQVLSSPNFDFTSQEIQEVLFFREPTTSPPSPDYLKVHRIKHGYD